MRIKLLILICGGLFLFSILSGQCPDNKIVRKEVESIFNTKRKSNQEKITELQNILKRVQLCPHKYDSNFTTILRQIGWVYFGQADYLNAIKYFRYSINVINAYANEPGIDSKDLIRSYYYLSTFYDSLNNVPEKLKAIDSCIYLAEKLNVPSDISGIRGLLDRAQYFFDVGDYESCITDAAICQRRAEVYVINESSKIDKSLGRDIAQTSIGWNVEAHLKLKRFSEAEELLTNKITEYKKTGQKPYLAFVYSEIAEVNKQKGNYEKGLFFYDIALRLYGQLGDEFNIKQILNKIGYDFYLTHYKDANRALANFRNALMHKNVGKSWKKADSIESLSIYGNIANVYVHKGLYDSAFYYFQLAFDQIKRGSNERDILISTPRDFVRQKKIHYLTSLLIDKGDAFLRKYQSTNEVSNLQYAKHIYAIVDKVLARIDKAQFDLHSRLFWRQVSRRLYESAIQVCYLSGDSNAAFYFFERSRAVLLSSQLSERFSLDSADRTRLVEMKKKIVMLGNAKDEARNRINKKMLQDSLSIMNQKYYWLEKSINVRNPLYYRNVDTSFLTLKETRKSLLNDHQALLEIFSGDSAVYSLLLTNGQSIINKIDKASFDELANNYIFFISNPELLDHDFGSFVKVSHQLYQLLFQNHPVPEERIIVSPEGRFFPFESLITDSRSTTPVYFLSRHAVSYTYSVRFLQDTIVSNERGFLGNFMGMAPVDYSPRLHMPSLLRSDLSLYKIGAFFSHVNNLVSKEASRNNFIQQFPGYKIVQLYTHASDSSDRKEPVIYFADSALYLSEVLIDQKPVTELIVLSACQTANGRLYQGEGIFNFNRGFATMGVPSSISNLWAVENTSTYRLTELFYEYVSEGLPLDRALQQAKLEYLRDEKQENKSPYYWAAAVLVGKTNPIVLDKPFGWIYLFAGIGLASLFLLGWIKIRRQKKIILIRDKGKTAP